MYVSDRYGKCDGLAHFCKVNQRFFRHAYGLATIIGSILSVIATLTAGKLYDKMGIKPMFFAGTSLFAVFSVMGLLLSNNTPIVYIAVVFALQSIAMSTLNSPATAMALSKLEGKERVDGSAIFNTLRQISSSLASTSVLIYTVACSNMTAVHTVYGYYGFITAAIAVSVIVYLKSDSKKRS